MYDVLVLLLAHLVLCTFNDTVINMFFSRDTCLVMVNKSWPYFLATSRTAIVRTTWKLRGKTMIPCRFVCVFLMMVPYCFVFFFFLWWCLAVLCFFSSPTARYNQWGWGCTLLIRGSRYWCSWFCATRRKSFYPFEYIICASVICFLAIFYSHEFWHNKQKDNEISLSARPFWPSLSWKRHVA